MKIKLYQDEELLNGTQHRLQQQEVHIWCMRWRNILPFWEKNQSIMSVEEIEKAEKYHFYIIEDDNLYDFYYAKETIVPLKALDYKNRVIYIKSFSKIWTPGLRMGFMLFPKKFLESIQRAKYTTDIATSGFLQRGVAYYLQ